MDIVCDLDNVVVKFPWKEGLRQFGYDICEDDLYTFDTVECLGIPQETIFDVIRWIYKQPTELILGSLDGLHQLEEAGHKIILYTARAEFMGIPAFEKWLEEIDIPHHDLEINGNYLSADVAIDDRVGKLLYTVAELYLLYDQPWNKSCRNLDGLMRRVHNWDEILQAIKEFESEQKSV